MSLLHLLTGGGPPPAVTAGDRVLSIGDWFFSATSGGEGVTSRNALAFPLGAPGGWRARWPVKAGQVLRARIEAGPTLTFAGQAVAAPTSDGHIWSDPITTPVAPGTTLTLRTHASGAWMAPTAYDWRVTGWQFGDAYDAASLAYAFPGPSVRPDIVVGPSAGPAVLIVGDSIIAGSGSYLQLGARDAGVPCYGVGTGGEQTATFLASIDAKVSGLEYSMWTHCIHQHGINGADLAGRVAAWQWGRSKGLRNVQTTILPATSSTDGWTTVEGQSQQWFSAAASALNAWLRDGAPLTAGAPADPGTIAAIRAGHPDHPLDAVWDTATTAYAPGYIDRWRVPGWAGDGVHPTATAHAGLAPVAAAYMRSLP